jgi:hypothetical protein
MIMSVCVGTPPSGKNIGDVIWGKKFKRGREMKRGKMRKKNIEGGKSRGNLKLKEGK